MGVGVMVNHSATVTTLQGEKEKGYFNYNSRSTGSIYILSV